MSIIKENNLQFDSKIRFSIVQDMTYNAFATEGNFIFVYTGMLQNTPDITHVLSIMCHELGHAYKHHIQQNIVFNSQRGSSNLVMLGLIPFLLVSPEAALLLSQAALEKEIYLQMQYSQKHEFEADEFGYNLMVGAGYSPQHFIDSIQNLDLIDYETKKYSHKAMKDYSTHPLTSKRVDRLKGMMKSLNSGHSFKDPKKIREDYLRIFALNFSEAAWPRDQHSRSIMDEAVRNKNNIAFWENLLTSKNSYAAYFQLLHMYEQDEQYHNHYINLLQMSRDTPCLVEVQSIETGLVTQDSKDMELRSFIRKYQQYLFSNSIDTNPKILSLLAEAYEKQGNHIYSRLALAKMYLLSGDYRNGLRIFNENKSLKESHIGDEIFYKLTHLFFPKIKL